MGVSTTHRINLSMWILIYSFSDTYYVWAACGFWPTKISIPAEMLVLNSYNPQLSLEVACNQSDSSTCLEMFFYSR